MIYLIHVLAFCFGWMLPSIICGDKNKMIVDANQCCAIMVFASVIYFLGYIKGEN